MVLVRHGRPLCGVVAVHACCAWLTARLGAAHFQKVAAGTLASERAHAFHYGDSIALMYMANRQCRRRWYGEAAINDARGMRSRVKLKECFDSSEQAASKQDVFRLLHPNVNVLQLHNGSLLMHGCHMRHMRHCHCQAGSCSPLLHTLIHPCARGPIWISPPAQGSAEVPGRPDPTALPWSSAAPRRRWQTPALPQKPPPPAPLCRAAAAPLPPAMSMEHDLQAA